MDMSTNLHRSPIMRVDDVLVTEEVWDQLSTLTGESNERVMRSFRFAKRRYAGQFISKDDCDAGCLVVVIESGVRVAAYIEVDHFVIFGFQFANPPFTGKPVEKALMVRRTQGRYGVVGGGGANAVMIYAMLLLDAKWLTLVSGRTIDCETQHAVAAVIDMPGVFVDRATGPAATHATNDGWRDDVPMFAPGMDDIRFAGSAASGFRLDDDCYTFPADGLIALASTDLLGSDGCRVRSDG